MLNGTGGQHESLSDKIHRFRGLFLVISVPLLLISFLLFLMPSRYPSDSFFPNGDLSLKFVNRRLRGSASSIKIFAVIFDAGSSGSRVHVFCFDNHLNLIPIGKDLELFQQTKPGLSAYAKDPKAAADSLLPLLEKAESVVPTELRHQTPVRVGATAGLRLLQGDAPDKILQAVRDLLKEKSTLKSKPEWIKVLDGTEEGAYQWMTINYLLENLGKKYMRTVGVVDMGGGSVQMAYAISEKNAAKAPTGNETYVKKMSLRGRDYHLYVHSYLKYGLLAARAEILKVENSGSSSCILVGYNGSYEYGGTSYPVSSSPSGSSMNKCRKVAIKALKVESPCKHPKCTFDGVWNGGGGKGQNNLYFSSFFYDKAAQVGFVDPNVPVAKVRPTDFGEAAKRACGTKLEEAKSAYPSVIDLPYICMDLVYQFALLVDGFGLDPWLEITLVKQVKYHGFLAEAAWPLGSAIDVVSSPM